jgi:hypothetical protein
VPRLELEHALVVHASSYPISATEGTALPGGGYNDIMDALTTPPAELLEAAEAELLLVATRRGCFSSEERRIAIAWSGCAAEVSWGGAPVAIALERARGLAREILAAASRPESVIPFRSTTRYEAQLSWGYLAAGQVDAAAPEGSGEAAGASGRRAYTRGEASFHGCGLSLDKARELLRGRPRELAALPEELYWRALGLFDLSSSLAGS